MDIMQQLPQPTMTENECIASMLVRSKIRTDNPGACAREFNSKITSAKQHVEDQPKQPEQTATKTPIILVGSNKPTADIIKKLLDLNPDVRSHLESTLLAAYNEQNAKPKTPASTEQQPVPGLQWYNNLSKKQQKNNKLIKRP
jgi:chemotaxis regulatin CheY-phosphate phosphatase CheZ